MLPTARRKEEKKNKYRIIEQYESLKKQSSTKAFAKYLNWTIESKNQQTRIFPQTRIFFNWFPMVWDKIGDLFLKIEPILQGCQCYRFNDIFDISNPYQKFLFLNDRLAELMGLLRLTDKKEGTFQFAWCEKNERRG